MTEKGWRMPPNRDMDEKQITPRRIQRKRTKGFRLQDASANPNGVIYVGRPTKWGNPFWHAQRFHGVELALSLYRQMAKGCWNPNLVTAIPTADTIYESHCEWLKRAGPATKITEHIRYELRGKDLACWCPLDQPCHADILLELANGNL